MREAGAGCPVSWMFLLLTGDVEFALKLTKHWGFVGLADVGYTFPDRSPLNKKKRAAGGNLRDV